jgi:transcriptional accessory protein Tex/SPT6
VQTSVGKVGADVVWANIIKKYNTVPFISKINPDITDYVTNKALDGVFKMILLEEKNIRTNLDARTSTILKKVFALQDKK